MPNFGRNSPVTGMETQKTVSDMTQPVAVLVDGDNISGKNAASILGIAMKTTAILLWCESIWTPSGHPTGTAINRVSAYPCRVRQERRRYTVGHRCDGPCAFKGCNVLHHRHF